MRPKTDSCGYFENARQISNFLCCFDMETLIKLQRSLKIPVLIRSRISLNSLKKVVESASAGFLFSQSSTNFFQIFFLLLTIIIIANAPTAVLSSSLSMARKKRSHDHFLNGYVQTCVFHPF